MLIRVYSSVSFSIQNLNSKFSDYERLKLQGLNMRENMFSRMSINADPVIVRKSTGSSDDAEETTPFIQNEAQRLPQSVKNFFSDFWLVSSKAIPMALSYTFNFEQIAGGMMALHAMVRTSDNAAAVILFQTSMSTAVRVSLSPLFSVSIRACTEFGELKREQEKNVTLYREKIHKEYVIQLKQREIAVTLQAGLILSVIVFIPATVALFFSKELLITLQQSPVVAENASRFLKPYCVSPFALAVRMVLNQILYASGDVVPSMCIGLTTFAIGTGFAIWFVRGGVEAFKDNPLAGIAWGYNIESYLAVFGTAAYLFFHKKYSDIHFLSRTDWITLSAELGEIIRIAGPLTFTMLVENALTFSMGIFAGSLGVKQQAALSYAMQMVFLSFLFLMAYGQATGHAVGRFKGDAKYEEASRIARTGLISTTIAVLPPCILVSAAPFLLYDLLNIAEDSHEMVCSITPAVLLGAAVMAARYNINQVLRVLGDHKGSTLTSACGMLFGVFLTWLLGVNRFSSIYVVAAGLCFGEGASLLGLLPRWIKRTKPCKIEEIQNNPSSAEIATWKDYICSFFTCCKTTRVPHQSLRIVAEGMGNPYRV